MVPDWVLGWQEREVGTGLDDAFASRLVYWARRSIRDRALSTR